MARPCGCAGECGCTILGGSGVSVSGSGTTRDPLRITLANPITGTACDAIMSCVGSHALNGLRYDGTTGGLAVRLSADSGNTLSFGSDGGLYTGGGTGGSSDSGVTVASLPAFVVAGAYGAGYSVFPEGQLASYRAGMDMNLPMMHVPVRRAREGQLVACHYRTLNTYKSTIAVGDTVTNFDLMQLANVVTEPGGPSSLTNTGYFGFGFRTENGIPRLSDVFDVANRRTVLYLEVKDLGTGVNDTSDPRYTCTSLRALIARYGLTKSVIVGAEVGGTGNTTDNDAIKNGLADCRADGIDTAIQITSLTQATAYTPTVVAGAGYKWVMMTAALADTNPSVVTGYISAGLQVMLYGTARQYQYNQAKTLAVRGVLSQDPLYASGVDNNFRYQSLTSTWNWPQPDYGRQAYIDDLSRVRDSYRGYVAAGVLGRIYVDGLIYVPGQTSPDTRPSAYNILAGEQCPIRDTGTPANTYGTATNYDITVGFVWSAVLADRTQWMAVNFGMPEDRQLVDGSSVGSAPKGYCFLLRQNGNFMLLRYDGVSYPGTGNPWQFQVANWASGYGNLTAGTEYRVKIQVRSNGIILGREDGGGSATKTLTGDDYTKWRGPYFALGRHLNNDADICTNIFSNLVVKVN